MGRPGASAGHGTPLPRSTRTAVAAETRPCRRLSCFLRWFPHRVVRLDAAGASLILLAWLLRAFGHSGVAQSRRPASPWLLGIGAFVLSTPWFWLIGAIFVPRAGV